ARSPAPARATRSASGSISIRQRMFPTPAGFSTLSGRFLDRERFCCARHYLFALRRGHGGNALEIAAEPDIGIKLVIAMLMKMQETATVQVKTSARFFFQP